jgi:hypothetical protein
MIAPVSSPIRSQDDLRGAHFETDRGAPDASEQQRFGHVVSVTHRDRLGEDQ